MTISVRQVIGIFGALMLAAATAAAQSIRGTVVDPADRPIPGVVVQLLDSVSAINARVLSNERGEFRVAASRPGTYRLRTLRIGYRPETSPALVLAAEQEVTKRLLFTGIKFSLDTVRVVSRNVCKMAKDSAATTFAVWEQVRAALNATLLTSATRNIGTTTVVYDRMLDPSGHRIIKQQSEISSDYVSQPWLSLNPDSLRKTGYVVVEGNDGSATYYAPGLDMLASAGFIEDHCFRLTTSGDTAKIGVAFEPIPDRRRVAEIKGTLFLDRRTSQLRNLDYRYVNVDVDLATGGAMEFAAMKDGMWAISSWSIRMPVFGRFSRPRGADELRLTGMQVTGGELSLAYSGSDTLWSRPGLTFAGSVVDSVSGAPVAGARAYLLGTSHEATADARGRVRIPRVLPGEYTLEVHTPSLDSVSAAHRVDLTFTGDSVPTVVRVPTAVQIVVAICGTARANARGVILGNVSIRGDTTPPRSVKVFAEWTEITVSEAGGSVAVNRPMRWLETRTNDRGAFKLCGVPINTALTLKVETDTSVKASASPVQLRIPSTGRFGRAELTLDPTAAKVSVFAGVVLTDSTKQPIVNVEVTLPELNLSTTTNEKGEFRLRNIPAGNHRVVVRRLGFGPVDAKLDFLPYQTVERQIFLGKVETLGAVNIVTTDTRLRDFEESRRMGFGQYLDRSQMALKEGQSFNSVLREFRGLQLVRGMGSSAWLATSRPTRANRVAPDDYSASRGAVAACYSDVFVDGQRVYHGRDGEILFDPNSIAPDQIEALEFYSSRMQVPSRYMTGRDCGALVITMRR